LAKVLIILALLAGFLYGWWQGYNAGWEDNDAFWDETATTTELEYIEKCHYMPQRTP
jgi:hypothetical protein